MAIRGRRAQANQAQAAQERDLRDIEMDDLRRQIQQLQERLERYETFEHEDVHDDVEYEDSEDPSQGFIDWDSPPTYDIDIFFVIWSRERIYNRLGVDVCTFGAAWFAMTAI
jgi:hypothetical protein